MTTARTHENRNPITRWVRPLMKKSARHKTIAAPETDSTYLLHPNYESVLELWRVLQPNSEYESDTALAKSITAVSRNDAELLAHITKAARDNEFDREQWQDRLWLNNNLTDRGPRRLQEELQRFNTALHVNILVRRLIDSGVIIDEKSPYVYEKMITLLLDNQHITNPASELIQALTIIAYIKFKPNTVPWTQAPRNAYILFNALTTDADYIVEHLERVIGILPELVKRQTHDKNIIEMLLTNETPALLDGAL